MRLLRKNLKEIWYKNYVDKIPIMVDDFETGEYEIRYTPLKKLICNITPRSNTNTNVNGNTFPGYIGNRVNYEKIVLTTDLNCGIDENSLLYIDQTEAPDYKVTALSKCKTHMSFVAEKINANND